MSRYKRIPSENGQSLVIIALGIIAFVAILALVVDGANAYAAKRQAQNAADAGAIAGATYMCKNHDQAGGITQARDYAINRNGAASALVTASLDAGTVVVTATVQRNTFFAGVIGFAQLTPVAVAEAACRPAFGVSILPTAWSCRANAGNQPGFDCVQKTINYCGGLPYGSDDKACTYILMDSVKVRNKNSNCNPNDPTCYIQNDLECGTPTPGVCTFDPDLEINGVKVNAGKIDCDMDNDCADELVTGGARSWLDLDGSQGGVNDLKDWICKYQTPPVISPHMWLPSENGVSTSVFHSVAGCVVGQDVTLPVFNNTCNGVPNIFVNPETQAQCTYGPDDNLSRAASYTNYHIITFAKFHITCIQTGKGASRVTAEPGYPWIDSSHKYCNGHKWAEDAGSIDSNDKTIEGYFVVNDLGGYSGPGDWFDAGTFTIVLTK